MTKGNYDIDIKELDESYKRIQQSYLQAVGRFVKNATIVLFISGIVLIILAIVL